MPAGTSEALILDAWLVLEDWTGKAFSDSVIAWVAYFPPLLFLGALTLAAWQLKNERQIETWWSDNGAMAVTGLFALAVYSEVFPRADYYHLVRVLPPVFLFFIVLLDRCMPAIREFLRKRVPSPTPSALLIMAAPIVFLIVIGVKDTWQPQ